MKPYRLVKNEFHGSGSYDVLVPAADGRGYRSPTRIGYIRRVLPGMQGSGTHWIPTSASGETIGHRYIERGRWPRRAAAADALMLAHLGHSLPDPDGDRDGWIGLLHGMADFG